MMDPVDTRFFTELGRVLAEIAPGETGLAQAIDRALASGAALDLRAARLALEGLEPALKDRLLGRVHARMASDLSAIWDFLPQGAGARPGPGKVH